jgi:hypothetical protein
MKRIKTRTCLTLCLALPLCFSGACGGEPDPGSPQQVSVATSADTPAPAWSYGFPGPTLCETHSQLRSFIEDSPLPMAVTYIQTAYSNTTACAMDNYFTAADFDDDPKGYIQAQLVPWLLQFFGCPGEHPIRFPEGQYSPIGLVPARSWPPTISATDFYMIVTTFLRAVATPVGSGPETGQCAFVFSQEDIARISVMINALGPQVINVFDPKVGLTHADSAGLNCYENSGYVGPVNVVSACGAADTIPFVCGAASDSPALYCPP